MKNLNLNLANVTSAFHAVFVEGEATNHQKLIVWLPIFIIGIGLTLLFGHNLKG